MKATYTYGLWGAVLGAALATVVGFSWGGWTTAGGAQQIAAKEVADLKLALCVHDMTTNPESLALLKTKTPNNYDDAVRDGWKPVGYTVPDGYQFRRDCGAAIKTALDKKATKS